MINLDELGKDFADRRLRMNYSLRDFEKFSKAKHEQDPFRYNFLGRNTVAKIELAAEHLFTLAASSQRSFIECMYGSVENFNEIFNTDIGISGSPPEGRLIPLYEEGTEGFNLGDLYGMDNKEVEFIRTKHKTAIYAIRMTTTLMAPKLFPSQVVLFSNEKATPGDIVTIFRRKLPSFSFSGVTMGFLLSTGAVTAIQRRPLKDITSYGRGEGEHLSIPYEELLKLEETMLNQERMRKLVLGRRGIEGYSYDLQDEYEDYEDDREDYYDNEEDKEE